jgi:transcriptional regulator with GAF, ATPase, and Fis domain
MDDNGSLRISRSGTLARFKRPDRDADIVTTLDQLAAELSSTLVRLSGLRIDEAIDATLSRLGETLGVDRVTVIRYSVDGTAIDRWDVWERPDTFAPGDEGLQQLSWYRDQLLRGDAIVLGAVPEDLPFEGQRQLLREDVPLRSHLTLPIAVAGVKVCALSVDSARHVVTWTAATVDRLRLVTEIVAAAIYRGRQERLLRDVTADGGRLGGRSGLENEYLREEVDRLHGFDEIIGESPVLRASLGRLVEVAPTDATVLLLGETGTGKEVFARALHLRSPRRHRPLVRVNCAALPPTLIESELFGHERGAFTGAIAARQGRFELADKGTLFLDEIGDLPLDVQAKLLRVLQEGEFERLGSSQTHKVDVRLIAATNCDLEGARARGAFRSDLFYRLNVFPIRVPALRDRREDIPRLVWFIIHRRQRALGRRITQIPPDVMEALQRYDWPGNVRELENIIERAMIRSTTESLLLPESLGTRSTAIAGDRGSLAVVERRHIEDVLEKCHWRINGAGNAAEQLGLHPNTLRFRMKKLRITRPASS